MMYKVVASYVTFVEAEVEADSFDEARNLYEGMDGGEFVADPFSGDWRLEFIQCEDTGETVEYV